MVKPDEDGGNGSKKPDDAEATSCSSNSSGARPKVRAQQNNPVTDAGTSTRFTSADMSGGCGDCAAPDQARRQTCYDIIASGHSGRLVINLDSDSEEGDDEHYIYTYKGGLAPADLQNSLFKLDLINDNQQNGHVSNGPTYYNGQGAVMPDAYGAGAAEYMVHPGGLFSPEMDFLEMDFDPSANCDADVEDAMDDVPDDVPNDVTAPDLSENSPDLNNIVDDFQNSVQLDPVAPDTSCDSFNSAPSTSGQNSSRSVCNGHGVTDSSLYGAGNSCNQTSPTSEENVKLHSGTLKSHEKSCITSPLNNNSSSFQPFFRSWEDTISQLNPCSSVMAKRIILGPSQEGLCYSHSLTSKTLVPPHTKKLHPQAMVWTQEEACQNQTTQIGVSACGATAVVNVLNALRVPFTLEDVKGVVPTKYRQEDAPLPQYLFSRSVAGTTAADLIESVHVLSNGTVHGKFFHFYPERNVDFCSWLSYSILKGAVPVATLNLQKGIPAGQPIPDAWHHQMIFGIDMQGVYMTNPLELLSIELIKKWLCSPSVLLVRTEDVLSHWDDSCDLRLLALQSDNRWNELNVLGQVVNVLRENMPSNQVSTSQKYYTEHVAIPASYRAGITLFAKVDSEIYKELRQVSDIPLKLS